MITTHGNTLKRLPKWLYKTAAQKWIDYTYPRHLFIETTASCNLRCSYCPRDRINKHMDYELFRAIIDEASFYGARSFSLHLFGEPFLYPRILDAVAYIKAKNRRHTVLLTTNGTRLHRFMPEVCKVGIDRILWTWRKEAKFSYETKEALREWGKFRVRFIKEVTPKEAREEWENWPNVEERSLHNYGGEIDLSNFGASATVGSRYPCYHLWLAPAVSWNGNILLCCADPHQKEILGTFPLMGVSEAWNSRKIKEARVGHLTGTYKGICKDCDVWKSYPSIF